MNARSKILILAPFLSLLVAPSADAALNYFRVPSSFYTFEQTMSFFLSMDSIEDLGCGPGALDWKWAVAGRKNVVQSPRTSGSFATNLIPDRYFYVAVVVYETGGVCNTVFLERKPPDYDDIFIINPPPEPGPTIPSPKISGRVQSRPEVSIIYPVGGSLVGRNINISYLATDRNDLQNDTREQLGLDPNPVAIYYSDTLDYLEPGLMVLPEDKKLIAQGQPVGGAYSWDTAEVPDGDRYRIIIDAADRAGDLGQAVSPFFTIDRTPPIFSVVSDPAVSRGEDVKITVDSSEELAALPGVMVMQRGGPEVGVDVRGKGKHFEGAYRVISGYDGPAVIKVSGKDLAGNDGAMVTKGGRFSVGVEPPPKPVILSPLDKEITASSTIAVLGRAREDTEVVLVVNGKDEYKIKASESGEFVFGEVKLDLGFNRGENALDVTSRDEAGNVSEAATLSIKFNSAPELVIVSPSKDAVLSTTTPLRINSRDKNNDKLVFTYEISRDGGANWLAVASAVPDRRVLWDTTLVPDGQYTLRVTADDGAVKTQVASAPFIIRNLSPLISFADGERTVTNLAAAEIKGTASVPEGVAKGTIITALESSLDDGKTWQPVFAADGNHDSPNEQFTFALNDLPEKLYTILFRAKDSRGLYGRAAKTLIVDFGPPAAPAATSPQPSSVLSDGDDQDPDTAGVQFALAGKAEAESLIKVSVDGEVFAAKAGGDGLYTVPGVTLKKHGENGIIVTAEDAAGNLSPPAKISLIYNNPPALKFYSPRPDRGLNHTAVIQWSVEDKDGDLVSGVSLSFRRGRDAPFRLLSRDSSKNSFRFDVGSLPEGDGYQLKLEASDGITPAETVVNFAVDNTPPQITVEQFARKSFRTAFTLTGRGQAADDFSGVEFVEYAIDSEHWFKALITSGFLTNNAAFEVSHPFKLDDGDYDVSFRAVDRAGNLSPAVTQKIRVDTTPPRVGSFTLAAGPFILAPEGASFKIISNSAVSFTVSLESDTEKAEITLKGADESVATAAAMSRNIALKKMNASNLWSAAIALKEPAGYLLSVSAEDFLGNGTGEVEIGLIEVIRPGKIRSLGEKDGSKAIPEAKITVMTYIEDTRDYERWAAEPYGEINPAFSLQNGEYRLLLPSGKYQLVVQALGFERLKSSEFEILDPRFIAFDFALKPRKGLKGMIENWLEQIYY